MSSELERLLRAARKVLPEPDPGVTSRARALAVASARRRGPRLRRAALAVLAATLVAGGVGLGVLVTPKGTAAPPVVGLGFLPERGWSVSQNGGQGTPADPAVAIAANVPLSPEDDAAVLPLSTLDALPANGVVIVVTFTSRGVQPWHDKHFPHGRFPLRARAAEPFGVQIRPDRPLGQYRLLASINRVNVDVNLYFGTDSPSPALFGAAQEQLDRLVVRAPTSPLARAGPAPAPVRLAVSRIVDRTWSCSPRYVTVVASPRGSHELRGATFTSAGYVRVSSGTDSPLSDLVAIARPGNRTSSERFPAAVYVSKSRCVSSRASVPLTRKGLPGPAVEVRAQRSCSAGGRLLVHFHAVVEGSGRWGPVGSVFFGSHGQTVRGELAVRDQKTGRPLAFATLGRGGVTQLWYSPQCL